MPEIIARYSSLSILYIPRFETRFEFKLKFHISNTVETNLNFQRVKKKIDWTFNFALNSRSLSIPNSKISIFSVLKVLERKGLPIELSRRLDSK